MPTLSPSETERKPTGLLRGQAAKIARIHKVSVTYVLRCAKEGRGRPTILATIEEYRSRNQQQAAASSAA